MTTTVTMTTTTTATMTSGSHASTSTGKNDEFDASNSFAKKQNRSDDSAINNDTVPIESLDASAVKYDIDVTPQPLGSSLEADLMANLTSTANDSNGFHDQKDNVDSIAKDVVEIRMEVCQPSISCCLLSFEYDTSLEPFLCFASDVC